MFLKFDGTGRPPRPAQVDALKWLESNWSSAKVLAISAPTAVGKSAISRALQLQHGGITLTPSNLLLDQYMETYPELNYVKGQDHYDCNEDGLSCQEKKEISKKNCENCPYIECRTRALEGEHTVANPISYFQLTKATEFQAPPVLIVDEAHTLAGMLTLLTSRTFRHGLYKYPPIKTTFDAVAWLDGLIERYKAAIAKAATLKDKVKLRKEEASFWMLRKSLLDSPEFYVIYTKNIPYLGKMVEYLVIESITPPKWLLKQVLKATKIVLLSATLLETDIWDLGLSDYKYLALTSPIPKEHRPVLYRPSTSYMGFGTDPAVVARWIKDQTDAFPDRNTIVHLSYGWVDRLKKYFPEALAHTAATKEETLEAFKQQGGLWLAAGCSEGIDLPNDLCRLNLIPMIIQANPTDPAIKKKLALPQGQLKYSLQSIRTLIQQVGRSTRSVTDHSIAIVGDSKLAIMLTKHKQYIPKGFLDSVVWRS